MKKQIKGSFEVKTTPLPEDDASQKIGAMRMTFEKRFTGPFDGTGFVSMMGVMDQSLGSGGYVALEKITGSVEGRKGEFIFQHSSFMDRGKPTQSITVIPDSGTGELKGLSGVMTVDIIKGQHFYTFDYELN